MVSLKVEVCLFLMEMKQITFYWLLFSYMQLALLKIDKRSPFASTNITGKSHSDCQVNFVLLSGGNRRAPRIKTNVANVLLMVI